MARKRVPRTASDVVTNLFRERPSGLPELKRRFHGIDKDEARRALLGELDGGRLDDLDFELLLEAFRLVGFGRLGPALSAIVLDGSRDELTRALALALLGRHEPSALEDIAGKVPPAELSRLATRPVAGLLIAVQADPEEAEAVTRVLASVPPPAAAGFFADLERHRLRVGTTASSAYGHALLSGAAPALRESMVAEVVAEGKRPAEQLLERLRDQAKGEETRRSYQHHLMSLRTRAAASAVGPPANSAAGRGWVGSCDGQGAFIVFAALDNPDGSITLANLCVRAAADIRSGFVLVRQRPSDIDEIRAEAGDGASCAFAEVDLAEVAAVVEIARERTRTLGIEIPEDAVPALALLDRVTRSSAPATSSDAAGNAAAVSLEDARRLLCRREYRAWFFDPGDLAGAGVSPPNGRVPHPEWLTDTARRLNTRAVRERVSSMARHMARFHFAMGEKDEGQLLHGLARITATDFASSPLVRAMLERSAGEDRLATEPEAKEFGDAALREHLRRTFFAGVRKAKASQLAGLDFTEIALIELEALAPGLPGELRPRDEIREQIGNALGQAFADALLRSFAAGTPLEPASVGRKLHAEALRTRSLPDGYAEAVAASVESELVAFFRDVCTECPILCFAHRGEDLSAAFFDTVHPARLEEPR